MGYLTFINDNIANVNRALDARLPSDSEAFDTLNNNVLELSQKRLSYDDLLHFIMCMNHASLLMRRLSFSFDLRQEFHPHIKKHWELLHPLIEYERQRRGGDATDWYAKHFELLYREIITHTDKS